MTRTLRIAAIALLASAVAAPAAAQMSIEVTEGIGFGNSQPEARINAVRAWIDQAVRDHGDGDWNGALKTNMNCFQSSGGTGIGTTAIGVEGPVSGSWSCHVKGVPASALN